MNMQTTDQKSVDSLPDPQASAAFDRHKSRFLALAAADLIQVNADIPAAITTAIGALPRIEKLRERLAALPELDHKLIARLADLIAAMQHAQGVYDASAAPADHIVAIAERGMKLRSMLLKIVDIFVDLGVIDAKVVTAIRVGSGYRDLAADLIALAELITQHWSTIDGHAPIDESTLTEARALSEAIYRAMGARQGSAEEVSTASDMRQRVFTLFVRAYDQTRRGISFLRWDEGDVNEIAPSIFTHASNSRGKEPAPAAPSPALPAIATPVVPAATVASAPVGVPVGNGVGPFGR